ncbi:MAG: 6-bladed beta-propeller [Bacteroidales bacterium]|nr:6-bladed beta-propeller [Bacteroidales bacterium]
MKKIYYLLLFLLLSIASCNSNKVDITLIDDSNAERIDFNNNLETETLSMNDIVDSVKIVTLETKDESLVHQIMDIIITDYRIFIYDNYQGGGIIIFDSDGKFIKRLKNGNGPGEINRVVGIDYDPYANGLIVLQNPFVQLYTNDGEYFADVMLDFPADHIKCLEKTLFFTKMQGHQCATIENFDKYSTIITNRDREIKSLAIPYAIDNPIPNNLVRISKEEIRIGVPGNDTIYTYKNDTLTASYIMDYSKYKFDMAKLSDAEVMEYQSNMSRPEQCVYRGSYLETETHQYFEFAFGQYPYSVYRNKKNGHIVSGYKFESSDYLICIPLPVKMNDNWFVGLSNAFDYKHGTAISNKYISQEDVDKLEKLKEDDNPYLIFFRPKDF